MQIQLDYDKTGLKVNIPDKHLFKIFQMKETPILADPVKTLREKLTTPIASKSLNELASKAKSRLYGRAKTVCIVVSDKTRPVPNKVILPVLLDILKVSGIEKEDITILIANGIHTPTEGKDLIELLGEEIATTYKIVNHISRDNREHTFLGKTSSGTPVYINKTYCDSDFKILTGFIEPHFMTGFSGGRKSICPGIASIETVRIHHSPKFLESPFSAPGIIQGNPCHEEALRIAKMAGVDFIVNVTLDSKKRITGIFTGDLEKAYMKGVEFCKEQVSDYVKEQVDIVITSGGGYPLDRDFYQTVKGIVGALEIVKERGTVIIVSGCRDGIGSLEFKRLLFEMKDVDSFMEMISQEDYFCIDQWEVEELVKALRKVKIKLFSDNLNAEDMAYCHVEPLTHINRGIAESIEEYGKDAKIAVIPHGPYTLAKLGGNCNV